jgi:hypothetical protein
MVSVWDLASTASGALGVFDDFWAFDDSGAVGSMIVSSLRLSNKLYYEINLLAGASKQY